VALAVRLLALAAWGWLAVALPHLTDASCDFFAGYALTLVWLLLAAVWLMLMVPVLAKRKGRLSWLTAGLAGCIGLGLSFSNIGLKARIALCESSLTVYASEVAGQGGHFLHSPQRVGLFTVDGEMTSQGVVLLYTSHSYLNREGIAYFPGDTLAPPLPRHHLRHLYGPWYWCCWRF